LPTVKTNELIPVAYGFGWGFRADDGTDWECLVANLRGHLTVKNAIRDAFSDRICGGWRCARITQTVF
jgi:hypothetical protein